MGTINLVSSLKIDDLENAEDISSEDKINLGMDIMDDLKQISTIEYNNLTTKLDKYSMPTAENDNVNSFLFKKTNYNE